MNSKPRLHALLDAVRGRLVRQIWLFGLGTAAAGAGVWLFFAYAADRWLHLPAPIRMFHGAVLVLLPLWLLRRHLFGLLRRVPNREGAALLLERHLPASQERLVSALQLAPRATDPISGPLIQRVQREAEAFAAGVDPGIVVDPRPARRRFAGGAVLAGGMAAFLAVDPLLTGIFFQRMLGRDVSWPRRTTLFVDVARGVDGIQVEEREGEIAVRLARGSDLELQVRAEGVVPDSIELVFEGGLRERILGSGRESFRTLLRSLQVDTTFHVVGGDDRRGLPVVRVVVLQPPDVAGVAYSIVPPRYSGLPEKVVTTPEAEVLAGSRVRVHVRPDPTDARGLARTFPDAREIPLIAMPWPVAPPGDSGAVAADALGFELEALESSRFRFELVDSTGLGNPEPGLFGVVVVSDRRPELTLLAPGQATVEVVQGGAVPVRLRMADDYGVASSTYVVRDARDEGEPLASGALALRPVIDTPMLPNGSPRELVGRVRLEVDQLGGGQPATIGQSYVLTLMAFDGREPVANESRTAGIVLRVVTADDLLRIVRDGLSRVGDSTDKLVRLVEGLGRTLGTTEEALEGNGGEDERAELSALAIDARRAHGDARNVARDLSQLAAQLLYARVDARAGVLFERLDTLLDASDERGFQSAPWRTLADEYAAGTLGAADLGGELVGLVGLALDVAEPHALGLVGTLDGARELAPGSDLRALVTAARQQQRDLANAAEKLRARLGEWDDFQSILGLTKDILGRQKNLEQRTRELSGKN